MTQKKEKGKKASFLASAVHLSARASLLPRESPIPPGYAAQRYHSLKDSLGIWAGNFFMREEEKRKKKRKVAQVATRAKKEKRKNALSLSLSQQPRMSYVQSLR